MSELVHADGQRSQSKSRKAAIPPAIPHPLPAHQQSAPAHQQSLPAQQQSAPAHHAHHKSAVQLSDARVVLHASKAGGKACRVSCTKTGTGYFRPGVVRRMHLPSRPSAHGEWLALPRRWWCCSCVGSGQAGSMQAKGRGCAGCLKALRVWRVPGGVFLRRHRSTQPLTQTKVEQGEYSHWALSSLVLFLPPSLSQALLPSLPPSLFPSLFFPSPHSLPSPSPPSSSF